MYMDTWGQYCWLQPEFQEKFKNKKKNNSQLLMICWSILCKNNIFFVVFCQKQNYDKEQKKIFFSQSVTQLPRQSVALKEQAPIFCTNNNQMAATATTAAIVRQLPPPRSAAASMTMRYNVINYRTDKARGNNLKWQADRWISDVQASGQDRTRRFI